MRPTLDSFGIVSLLRMLGYHWYDFVSNEQFLRQSQIRHLSCIVTKHHLQHYGHVTHFSAGGPTHGILIAKH